MRAAWAMCESVFTHLTAVQPISKFMFVKKNTTGIYHHHNKGPTVHTYLSHFNPRDLLATQSSNCNLLILESDKCQQKLILVLAHANLPLLNAVSVGALTLSRNIVGLD